MRRLERDDTMAPNGPPRTGAQRAPAPDPAARPTAWRTQYRGTSGAVRTNRSVRDYRRRSQGAALIPARRGRFRRGPATRPALAGQPAPTRATRCHASHSPAGRDPPRPRAPRWGRASARPTADLPAIVRFPRNRPASPIDHGVPAPGAPVQLPPDAAAACPVRPTAAGRTPPAGCRRPDAPSRTPPAGRRRFAACRQLPPGKPGSGQIEARSRPDRAEASVRFSGQKPYIPLGTILCTEDYGKARQRRPSSRDAEPAR